MIPKQSWGHLDVSVKSDRIHGRQNHQRHSRVSFMRIWIALDDMTMDLGPLEWAKRIRMVRQVVPVVDFRVPTEQGNTAFDGSILMVGRSIFKCFTACKVDVRYPGSPAQKIRANFPEKKHPHSNKRINNIIQRCLKFPMFSGILVETIKSYILGEKETFVTNQEFLPSTFGGSQIVWVKHPGVLPWPIWCRGTLWVPIYGKVVVVAPPTSRASQLGCFTGRSWTPEHLQSPCGFVDFVVRYSHWLNKSFGSCKLFVSCGCVYHFWWVNFGTLPLLETKSHSMLKSGLSSWRYSWFRSLLLACNSVTPSLWKFPKIQMAGS